MDLYCVPPYCSVDATHCKPQDAKNLSLPAQARPDVQADGATGERYGQIAPVAILPAHEVVRERREIHRRECEECAEVQ